MICILQKIPQSPCHHNHRLLQHLQLEMTAISKSKNGFSSILYLWIYCGCHSNILIISLWYYQKIEVNWSKKEGIFWVSCTMEVLLTCSDRHKLLHFVPNIYNMATCWGFHSKYLFFFTAYPVRRSDTFKKVFYASTFVCVVTRMWRSKDDLQEWFSPSAT